MISIVNLICFLWLGTGFGLACSAYIIRRFRLGTANLLPLGFLCWHCTNVAYGVALITLQWFTPLLAISGILAIYCLGIFTCARSAIVRIRPFSNLFIKRDAIFLMLLVLAISCIQLLYARHLPSVSWYYLNQAQDLLQLGSVPPGDYNFGQFAPFEVNKIFTTIELAYFLALNPRYDFFFTYLAVYQVMLFTAFVLLFYSLAWQISNRRDRAISSVIIAAATPFVAIKFSALRGDSLGVVATLAMLAVIFATTSSRWWAFIAGFGMFIVFNTHPISGGVLAVVAGCYLLLNITPRLRTLILSSTVFVALQLILTIILGSNLLITQTDMLSSLIAKTQHSQTFVSLISPAAPISSDTYGNLWSNIVELGKAILRPNGIVGLNAASLISLFVLTAISALSTYAFFRSKNPVTRAFVSAAFTVTIIGCALHFATMEHVARTHIWRRELPYFAMFLVLPAVAFIANKKLNLLLCSLASIWSLHAFYTQKSMMNPITANGERALAYLREHVQPHDTVLLDGTSAGIIHFWTSGIGLLEGRAPYFQHNLLLHTNTTIEVNKKYFLNPAGEMPADWVVTNSSDLGVYPNFILQKAVPTPPLQTFGRVMIRKRGHG